MDRREPSFRSFIAAFRGHWFDAMSGGASVPFAIAAVLAGEKYQQVLLWAASISCLVVAGYRIWAAERTTRSTAEARVAVLEGEYAYCLNITAIDVADEYVLDGNGTKIGRTVQFQPIFQNVLQRPLGFQVNRTVLDGNPLPPSSATIITAGTAMRFFTQHIKAEYPAPKIARNYLIELEYTYGEPANHSRSAKKTIVLTRQPDGKIAWAYQVNEDVSCQ